MIQNVWIRIQEANLLRIHRIRIHNTAFTLQGILTISQDHLDSGAVSVEWTKIRKNEERVTGMVLHPALLFR